MVLRIKDKWFNNDVLKENAVEIEVHGIKAYYECAGEGRELVLLHGWGASSSALKPVADFFSKDFKVVSVDFPGFGKTPSPDTVWDVEAYSSFTAQLISQLGLINPILIGHSFGGRVIIHMVAHKKVAPSRIVLVDSAGIKPTRSLWYYCKVYAFKGIKQLLLLRPWRKHTQGLVKKARNFFGSADYNQAEGILRQIMVKVVNQDLTKHLKDIDAPTLLVWGEKDTATPLKDARIMEKRIPDAGLVILKGAGHYSYLDKLHEFNTIVQHFLKP
jgi:pimeloyl-ACP methyl ester carboxylesterase